MSKTHAALGVSIVAASLSISLCAAAQSVERALQLGLGTSPVQYTSGTATTTFFGQQAEEGFSSFALGLGPESGVLLEGGYGLSEMVVLGGLLQAGNESVSTEPATGGSLNDSRLDLLIGPKVDLMLSPGRKVRPFLTAAAGLDFFSYNVADSKTEATGFEANLGLGLRWFAAPGVSFDPALVGGWGMGSGTLSDQAGGIYDYSFSAFALGLRLAVSGWLLPAPKAAPKPAPAEDKAGPPAEKKAAPAASKKKAKPVTPKPKPAPSPDEDKAKPIEPEDVQLTPEGEAEAEPVAPKKKPPAKKKPAPKQKPTPARKKKARPAASKQAD
jgi:hypothetical protein